VKYQNGFCHLKEPPHSCSSKCLVTRTLTRILHIHIHITNAHTTQTTLEDTHTHTLIQHTIRTGGPTAAAPPRHHAVSNRDHGSGCASAQVCTHLVCVCVCVCFCMCVHVSWCVHLCMCMCMHVCVSVCVDVCPYVHAYACTSDSTSRACKQFTSFSLTLICSLSKLSHFPL
jgi:hypothetical protein